jgi:uncharacterized membrane protein
MERDEVRIFIAVLVAGLIIAGILGGLLLAFPREVVKEVPKEVIKEIPKEVVKEETKEVPMTLPALAEKIRNGEIDSGTEHGLALDQRYHKIHATVLGLECATCHISEPDTTQTVFNAQDVSPQAPGPVDKKACLSCHRAGPGEDLYDLGSP